MKINKLSFALLSLLTLSSCQLVNYPLQTAIAQSQLTPVGDVKRYQILVVVESDIGVEKKSQIVEALVTGRYAGGPEISDKVSLTYPNGRNLTFINKSGDRFIVNNSHPAYRIDKAWYPEKSKLIYKNGQKVAVRGGYSLSLKKGEIEHGSLYGSNAIAKYGFRLVDYKIKRIK